MDHFSRNPDFRLSLTASALQSYDILRNWWRAAYCEDKVITAAKQYIERQSDIPNPPDPLTSSDELDRANLTIGNFSLYYCSCFKLFLLEFFPQGADEDYESDSDLRDWLTLLSEDVEGQRQATCEYAIMQRLAFTAMRPRPVPVPLYPKIPLQSLARVGSDRKHTALTRPYFLWDTTARRTALVHELSENSCPDYVCVSHTWGRWRIEPPAHITGVPWPVPRCTRFDIEGLPGELEKLGERYVWLDLFCIPQERSTRADEEIARQASIFRGAQRCVAWLNDVETWEGTEAALKWWSLDLMVDKGWGKLPSTQKAESQEATDEGDDARPRGLVGRLASSMPLMEDRRPRQMGETAHFSDYGIKRVYVHSELMTATDTDEGSDLEAVSWFSSLWTLQEAILCPEMELCSRTWVRLADGWGTPISLKNLMVFLERVRLYDFDPDMAISLPAGPRSLDWLLIDTSMGNMLSTESPVAIWANANVRQCTDSRAPAIMSALGLTDWWHSRGVPITNPLGEEEDAEQLVLDMYPLGFVREAARKFGSEFYNVYPSNVHLDDAPVAVLERNALGTMLPFKRLTSEDVSGTEQSFPLTANYNFYEKGVDHVSVPTWWVRADGSVRITRAGIALSSESISTNMIDKIAAYVGWAISGGVKEGFDPDATITEDLGAQMSIVAADCGRVLAVVLSSRGGLLDGVFLYGLKGESSGPQYFIKIGNFFMKNHTDPITIHDTVVDWIVL